MFPNNCYLLKLITIDANTNANANANKPFYEKIDKKWFKSVFGVDLDLKDVVFYDI